MDLDLFKRNLNSSEEVDFYTELEDEDLDIDQVDFDTNGSSDSHTLLDQ